MQSNSIPLHDHDKTGPDPKVWRRQWRRQLPRISDLPLLAVGGGPDRKAPANLRTGEPLKDWQRTAHTHTQIGTASPRVCGAGLHTGRWGDQAHSILVADIDGAAAVEHCLAHSCDPQATRTWQTHRNTDPCRLKVKFKLTPEQADQLGNIKTSLLLKEAIKDEAGNVLAKAEALEIFHQPNSQVVVLGEHPTSKGFYFWPDDMGPEALAPITPEWWALVLDVVQRDVVRPSSKATSTTPRSSAGEWGNCNPCPICGRNTSNWCSRHRSTGAINCRHGNTFNPEQAHGVLRLGDTIPGADGTRYAFCGTETQSDGTRFSKFVIDKPRERGTAPDRMHGFKDESWQASANAPSSAAANPADPSRAEVQRRTYSELVEATLAAVEHNDVDTYAELVAELMRKFSKPASAIQAALMRLLTERHAAGATTPKPGYTDITDVEHLDDLVPGFVAANEQTLLHAPKGTGKTLAALLIAKSVVLGQGMLDRSEAPQQGRVLYLATDSGCESMFTQMQELGLLELPEFGPGPQQRFFIRGHHARQGTSAWEATIPEILWLLREVKQQRFDLVIIDSAKACMELTDSEYTDNKAVGAMLTLFQRVVCPHAAVLWLHHDGRENGHNAGAKVWAERPVMVHRLERVEPPKKGQQGGSGEDDNGPPPANPPRRWECIKSRVPGGERQFIYCLQPSGEFEVAPDVEIVGNCREAVLSVMRQAAAKGEDSLRYADLVQRVERSSGRSLQTIKNTISRMKRGKEADLRPLSHGRYALSARARVGGVNVFGTKSDQNPVVERVLNGTEQGTDGTESVPMPSTGGTESVPTKSKVTTGETANAVPIHTHTPARGRSQAEPSLADAALRPHPPLVGSGADVFGGDDDPAWGPRRDAA